MPFRITASQIRAARALLGWSQQDLADRCGLSRKTLMLIETETAQAKSNTLARVEESLALVGVRFLSMPNGIGVLLESEDDREKGAKAPIE